MLNKFLLITLGGSGEKLARYLAQDLKQRLRRKEWDRDVPSAWRWLCVDVAHASDVITNDVPSDLGPTGARLAMTKHRIAYPDYHHALTRDSDRLRGLVGALPAADSGLPSPYYGAGQRPQVGNAVGLMELKVLSAAITDQMNQLNAPKVADELREVSELFDTGREPGTAQTTLMIASSLGGGSGAGLLQLVTELVLSHAATGEFRESLTTLLFTPDIFVDLSDRARAGVQANALYTVSTLLNGYRWKGEPPQALQQLVASAGVNLRRDRRAAVTNFFVGDGNKAVTFGHQDRAIKAVSKALGRLLVDEEMALGLAAHLETNRNGAPVADRYLLTEPAEVSRPASSLGYASVSLGDSLLAEYASERLAKEQLDTFLRGHVWQRSAGEPDEAAITRIAGEKLEWFVEELKLGKEQVLSSLYDSKALGEDVEELVRKLQEEIGEGKRRKETGKHWFDTIGSPLIAYKEAQEEARSKAKETQEPDEWRVLHDRLCAVTATSIARLGAPVTIELLKRAQQVAADSASALRRTSEESLKGQSRMQDEQNRGALQRVEGRIRNDDPLLSRISKKRGEVVRLKEESVYYDAAAGLLESVHEFMLPPMVACVEAAVNELGTAEKKHHRKLTQTWAGEAMPQRLYPADNQHLLEPAKEFPELFKELIRGTIPGAYENVLRVGVEELLTGKWKTRSGNEYSDGRLIRKSREWSPDSTAPAVFELQIDAHAFYARAKAWVWDRPGALSDRLRLPLAKWIEDPVRAQSFVQAMEEALHLAEPLATINDTVHQRVHDSHQAPPTLYVSTIPVAFDSAVGQRIAAALGNAGVTTGEIPTLFDEASQAQVVEISSFLSQPVEPLVVENLFWPIQDDWVERENSAKRMQFSAFRRTRPLPYFVPISQVELKRFIVGWIVGRLSGLITDLEDSWSAGPMSVWSDGKWLQFPRYLLGGVSPTDESDILGHVLESFPLAMASFASERYEELTAYMRVIELGDLVYLPDWLCDGPRDLDPESEIEGGAFAGETPEARRQTLLAEVHRQRAETEKYIEARPIGEESVSALPPRLEIAELFLEGLGHVQDALMEISCPSDIPPDGDPTPLTR